MSLFFVLSPAKKLKEDHAYPSVNTTQIVFRKEVAQLIDILRPFNPVELAKLFRISDPLAVVNCARFQNIDADNIEKHGYPAVFLFDGDAYQGLAARSLKKSSLDYLKKHLGILSGLYGLLGAFDLIAPYRLEMGTRLPNARGKDLYAFWEGLIRQEIERRMALMDCDTLINLASNEYFKSVEAKQLSYPVVTPVFKEYKNGTYRVISFYAKHARGLMVRFAAENHIRHAEALQSFSEEGYRFSEAYSDEKTYVFLRG